MKIINPDYQVKKIDDPYEIWIIDNFLEAENCNKILEEWVDENDPRWFRGRPTIGEKKNVLEHGMIAISQFDKMPEFTRAVVEYFHTDDFTNIVKEITGYENLVTDYSARWSGLRVMLPDSYQLIHSDARQNPINGLQKELTLLLYLNKGYNKEKDEGCLEVWDDEMKQCLYEIEPLYNRMVIFKNLSASFHGVPVVKSARRAITFSVLAETKSQDRTKALFVPRPFDSPEVKEIGMDRAKLNDY